MEQLAQILLNKFPSEVTMYLPAHYLDCERTYDLKEVRQEIAGWIYDLLTFDNFSFDDIFELAEAVKEKMLYKYF